MKPLRKQATLAVTLGLALILSLPTLASEGRHGEHDKNDKWSDFRMIQTERHKMITKLMVITRDITDILRHLNHKPSAAEKDALDRMGRELDDMLAHDKELSRKMAHKWKKKWSDKD